MALDRGGSCEGLAYRLPIERTDDALAALIKREMPFAKYPWDGVSGVRPFHELADATTVGVY